MAVSSVSIHPFASQIPRLTCSLQRMDALEELRAAHLAGHAVAIEGDVVTCGTATWPKDAVSLFKG